MVINRHLHIIGKLAADPPPAANFLVVQASAKLDCVARLTEPQLRIQGEKFDLMRVDDDHFGFYDQHDADDIELGAAVQD